MAALKKDTWRRASIVTESIEENWGENILGRVIKPALEKNPRVRFWFSRYDFDNGEREILLSYRLEKDNKEFEKELSSLAAKHKYTTRFLDFDMKNGPGGIGTLRFTNKPSDEIYEINLDFLQVISRIVIANLEVVNGINYIAGISNVDQNPHGSVFESFHHMFWNMTQCPMHVYVSRTADKEGFELHTMWTKRPNKMERQQEIPVHY
jgi:hypothetical protein